MCYIALILGYSLDLFSGGPVIGNLVRILFCFGAIMCNILSARYHPLIFQIFYSSLVISYSLSESAAEDGIVFLCAVTCIPIFIYFFTGSFWFFLLQIFAQGAFMNKFYQEPMKAVVINMFL